jgi:transcriptional regulator with XRE-family HTH domain
LFDAKISGEKIASLRKEKGMTQEELAEKMGVSSQAVSKWENGNAMPEVALLVLLSQILDCSTDNILNPSDFKINQPNFIQMLLPYQDVAPYAGAWWPRGMAFPAVMTALKLFMGLEERHNFNHHQINDDQEYILQSGISTLAFGFSHYNMELIHDCFQIYGLDYKTVTTNHKTFEEIIAIIRRQIQKGYPVIIQDKSNNAAFLFVTGIIADGQKIRAHEFVEGLDEKNCNMNPYDMEVLDNWLKPDMEILLLFHTDSKLDIEKACKKAIYNYCLMMSGRWDKEEFISSETPDTFRQFMCYGSDGYCSYINYLQRGSLEGFYPQQCIFHESNISTLGFFKMCKEYIKDINQQSLNAAIDRYQALKENSWEIINISWNDPARTESDVEKAKEILNILIRSNEIFRDAVKDIMKAINFTV